MGPATVGLLGASLPGLGVLSLGGTLLLAAGWAAARGRSSAADRHEAWAIGVAGALILPLAAWAIPVLPPTSPLLVVAFPGAVPLTGVSGTGGPASVAPIPWAGLLVLLWAAGAAWVALRALRSHLTAFRHSWAAEEVRSGPLWEARALVTAALGAGGGVAIGRSAAIRSPMTLGVLRQRVLLPADADAWPTERLVAALTHELAHVQRRDTLVQAASQLVCALYWWSPLAWYADTQLRIEREHACDDAVLNSGVRPSSYAAALWQLARTLSSEPRTSGVCMADLPWTEVRLRRILDPHTPRRAQHRARRIRARIAMGLCVGALACASSPVVQPAARAAVLVDDVPPVAPLVTTPGALTRTELGVTEDLRAPYLVAAPGLTLFDVEAEVNRHMATLDACFRRRLAVKPGLSGEIEMHWAIAPSGIIEEQCLTSDTVEDTEVTACLTQLIEAARFPVSEAGMQGVTFPFRFSAAGTL